MSTRRLTIELRRLRFARALRFAAISTIAVAFAGCQTVLSRMIVYAPNHGRTALSIQDGARPPHSAQFHESDLQISVGPPAAELAIRIIDPPSSSRAFGEAISTGPWTRDPSTPIAARGTILVLHGIHACKEHMRPVAELLATAGYRAILVDLRGHGRSTGDWLTYGVVESRDLSQVLSQLEVQGLVAGKIGVYGASYGGGVAIQFAGCDSRVQAVVTVAAFSSLRDVVPPVAKLTIPGAHLFSDDFVGQTLAVAGLLAGFDPDEADGLTAIPRTNAAILLFHGDRDLKIPCAQSRKLAEAAGSRARYIELKDENHTSIMWDRRRIIADEMLTWFDRYLAEP